MGGTDAESLQVVGVGSGEGQLWHTIHNPDGTWQSFFGLVENEVAGGAPFAGVSCAGTSQGLQVVALESDGQLWHTIRNPDGTWQPFFGLVENEVAGGPQGFPSFFAVSCGSADLESLQVVASGSDGQLWHTIRNPDGTWQPFFGLVENEVAGGPPNFYSVSCGSTDFESLQVVALGSDGQLWHTIRNPDGTWQPFFGLVENEVAGGPVSYQSAACAGTTQGLQVVAIGGTPQLRTTDRRDR